jgi:hypothetical protein
LRRSSANFRSSTPVSRDVALVEAHDLSLHDDRHVAPVGAAAIRILLDLLQDKPPQQPFDR